MVGMRTRLASLATALLVTLAATGCGPDVKKENDQLKAQVATLQKENLALKGEATSLKADAEAMKKRFEAMNKEKQVLEAATEGRRGEDRRQAGDQAPAQAQEDVLKTERA